MNNPNTNKTLSLDHNVLKKRISEALRLASVSCLKSHGDCTDIEIRELDSAFKPGRMLASNMVFILVSGESIRITFKTHFRTRTAREFAFGIFGAASPADISERQALDYFKEYGNLVAGSIVTLFGKIGNDLGIGLPLCTRGFYEIFADYVEKGLPTIAFSDFWELRSPGMTDASTDGRGRGGAGAFFCSALIEVMNAGALAGLMDLSIEEELRTDSAEMDFL